MANGSGPVVAAVFVVFLWQLARCSGYDHGDFNYYDDIPTESPDVVEQFDPNNWVSYEFRSQQIEIQVLKLQTQVKLRYARTRITLKLRNPHVHELQSDFRIVLPENAFFATFQLKKGSNPRTYTADIVKKDIARKRYHAARSTPNGTVSAAYIELSPKSDGTRNIYNLKVSLPADESIQAFLVFERQLERRDRTYKDQVQVYPFSPSANFSKVGQVEFAVSVEELEGIGWLRCKKEVDPGNFSNCSVKTKKRRNQAGKRYKSMELVWRESNVAVGRLEQHNFQFEYQMQPRNDTATAVVLSQNNGNFYFVHLFVPENLPKLRKHIVFVLDVSDSMHGKKLDQLQWGMKEILEDLSPHDFFNIIAFANDITEWTGNNWRNCSYPIPATESNKESAALFIHEGLLPHGTTNIFQAIYVASHIILQQLPEACPENPSPPPENLSPMIFFLTDGKATAGLTDPALILERFQNLNQNLSSSSSIPIHTIAYGSDADTPFLKALSSFNGGVNKVIVPDSAAGMELNNFYDEISSQVLSQVQTSFTPVAASAVNSSKSSSNAKITSPVTVIQGGEILTAGILAPETPVNNGSFSPANYTWSTEAYGKNGRLAFYNSPVYDCTTLQMSLGKCVDRINFYLERLAAYQLLKKLLERDKFVELGYICPKSYYDQFQDLKMERLENSEEGQGQDHQQCFNIYQQQATELALKHGFVTPYTSFVLTTAEVDSGLKSPDSSRPHSSDEDMDSTEFRLPPLPPQKTEKLLMCSFPTRQVRKIAPQLIVGKPEPLPTAEKLVENNLKPDNFTANNNGTVPATKNNGTISLFSKSLRDRALQILKNMLPSTQAIKE